MTDIDNLVSKFEAMQSKFQTDAQKLFKKTFKEFFQANPRISKIEWTQYTPYFNDGDECVFGVNDFYAHTEDDEEFGRYGLALEGYRTETDNFKEFAKDLDKIPEVVYNAMFGDHCQVSATREGFDVSEYDHE